MFDIKYKEAGEIKDLIRKIEELKIVFDKMPMFPHIEERIRRESLLKSSLFSARIEGNKLTLQEVSFSTKQNKNMQKLEVFNLVNAYNFVRSSKTPKKLSENFVRKLHRLVMKNISGAAGKPRQEPSAIFNQAGVAIYLAPPHHQLPKLFPKYFDFVNGLSYHPAVNSAIAQFVFEKLHPFADGNGRVGRLISAHILLKEGLGFRGLVSNEEYIDKNKQVYYQALEPSKKVTAFVEFFLESLVKQADLVLDQLSKEREEKPEDKLLPRRREIFEIVREHPQCSFDFIARRFSQVNKKTLHYDIKKLQDEGFIEKIGVSRGVIYRICLSKK